MNPIRRRRLQRTLLSAGLLLLTLVVAGPSRTVGRVSLASVQGTSMMPTYQSGDLVVAWRAEAYAAGDVVVYAVPGGQVIHRIVGSAPDGGFVTQGDNRDRRDPWRPSPDHVRGKAVAHVPAVGRVLEGLGQPSHRWLLAGAVAMALIGIGSPKPRRRLEEIDVTMVRPRRSLGAAQVTLLAGASLIVALAVVVLHGRHPEVETVQAAVVSEHRWSTQVVAHHDTGLYPSPYVVPQEGSEELPLYLEAMDTLEIRVLDEIALPPGVDSELSVRSEIVALDGWRAPLDAPVDIGRSPERVSAEVRIPVAEAVALGEQHAAASGRSGATWSIVVTPEVAMAGEVDGREVSGSASTTVVLPATSTRISAPAAEDGPVTVPLAEPVVVPARFGGDRLSIALPLARRLAWLLVAASTLVLLVAGSVSAGWVGRGRAGLLDLRLGGGLIRVGSLDGLPPAIVWLAAVRDLRNVARRQDGVVLRAELEGGVVRYAVAGADQTYVLDVAPGWRSGDRQPRSLSRPSRSDARPARR